MPNRFAVLAESSPVGIYHVQAGLFEYANPALASMFGYHVGELRGTLGLLDLVHRDDRPSVTESFRSRRDDKVGGSVERARGLRKDGSLFPVEVHGRWIEYDGRSGMIGALLDISERQCAEDELRRANAKLEEAQRVAHFGWWERDYETARVLLSEEARRIFGVRAVDLPDWHGRWLELIHPEDRARVAEASAAALSGGPRYDVEYRVIRPDGTSRVVHSKGDVTWDRSGRPLRQFGVIQDITELGQAERHLRTSEAQLRTFMDRATDAFFEVRQPIAATITSAQAAMHWLDRAWPDLDKARQALTRIVRDASRAADVIAGTPAPVGEPRRDPVALNASILDVLGLVEAEIRRHGVTVRTELAERLPPVQGDKAQLRQVVLNLIVNAIEAMDRNVAGASRLLVVATAATVSGGVTVSVRDSGPGLGDGDPERFFDGFHTTQPKGAGIGLAICRSIVEAHGGRLRARQCDPNGARFEFTIPEPAS